MRYIDLVTISRNDVTCDTEGSTNWRYVRRVYPMVFRGRITTVAELSDEAGDQRPSVTLRDLTLTLLSDQIIVIGNKYFTKDLLPKGICLRAVESFEFKRYCDNKPRILMYVNLR